MADVLARPTPLTLTGPAGYDRDRWQAAVLNGGLHSNARLVALVLAHLAGPSGILPAGGAHSVGRLARQAQLAEQLVRISLNVLEAEGYFSRPDIHTWRPQDLLRPITLTLPSPSRAAVRQEPPHPGSAA